jgi:hypothetical protein
MGTLAIHWSLLSENEESPWEPFHVEHGFYRTEYCYLVGHVKWGCPHPLQWSIRMLQRRPSNALYRGNQILLSLLLS